MREPWALFTWEEVAACRFAAYLCDSPCLQICICVDPFCSFETSCLIGSYWLCPLLPGPQGWDRVCPWELSPQQTKPKSQRGSFLSSLSFDSFHLFSGALCAGPWSSCWLLPCQGERLQEPCEPPGLNPRLGGHACVLGQRVCVRVCPGLACSKQDSRGFCGRSSSDSSRLAGVEGAGRPGRGPSAPAVRPWAALSPSLRLPRALRPQTGPLTAWPRCAPARLWVFAHRALSPGCMHPSSLPGDPTVRLWKRVLQPLVPACPGLLCFLPESSARQFY